MERTRSTPFSEYVQQQQRVLAGVNKVEVPGGKKLWRQIVAGLTATALFGMVLLVLGSAFMKGAIESQLSFITMLCVLGIVSGLIVIVGSAVMAKLIVSRKWRVQEGQQPPRRPPEQCFNTCSIIYTPSQDQLAPVDQPPSYEMATRSFSDDQSGTLSSENMQDIGVVQTHGGSGHGVQSVVVAPPSYSVTMLPPDYNIASAPLPKYGDPV